MNQIKISMMSAALAVVMFSACGGGSETQKTENNQEQQAPQAAPSEKPLVELSIEGQDDMKYNLNVLEVPAGSRVKLTMKNVGKLPKEAMGHNWSLLEAGTDVAAYAIAAVAAKANDYQPADRYNELIISTRILGPGESETIEFDAPPVGTYKFICTFPGHYLSMQGDFIVK